MSASGKFDGSSGSPDRPLYANRQRGSYTSASLDRSGSFREGMDNPILSALPSMSRSSMVVTEADVRNFLQCSRFDPKSFATELKVHRQGELKQLISSDLGILLDDAVTTSFRGKLLPSSALDNMKRVKAILREHSNRARDRAKVLSDVLSTFNKFFPSIGSRKRSRLDGSSSDRSSMSQSIDRSILSPNMGKMEIQNPIVAGGFDLEQQKPDERIKISVPSKRTRTSLVDGKMDVRPNALARQSGSTDKDREMLRLANISGAQAEDRSSFMVVDGWEKSKMKKKRSGIKPDVIPGKMSTKPIEGYREPKQGLHQRLVPGPRLRLNDSNAFRSGVSNGSAGVGKADGEIQQTGSGNICLLPDRKDQSIGSDKERVNIRAVIKEDIREDFSSASTTSNIKMTASSRAPRSGTSMVPKFSPVHQAAPPSDWDFSHCTNNPLVVVGSNNRKRTLLTRSSSPPVTQWSGQRPQKISRSARKTNHAPLLSSNDETLALDTVSDTAGNENDLGFLKCLPGNSSQQVKLIGEHFSSATLSESEESAAADTKSKDKTKKSDELDKKGGQNIQKVSTLVMSSRKNKVISGEYLGDGVRRQGRTGRCSTVTRSVVPMVGKLGNVGNVKQLRSVRQGVDKSASKAGRPPTRKLSERKAYPRQKHTTINATTDFLVGSDDGHEELLAAAKDVIIHNNVFSSPFWKHMEPFFKFISDVDIAYLKQQGNFESTVPSITFVEQLGLGMQADGTIPLCQRLLAALITEKENNEFCSIGYEYLKFDVEMELESSSLNPQTLGDLQFSGRDKPIANGTYFNKIEHDHPENYMMAIEQYSQMSMNERLLLEIQSIGIFPEMPNAQLADDEEISENISKLEDRYLEQVSKNQEVLSRLLKSSSEIKELQDKEIEGRALDKLVGMAYDKYMACWGSSTSGGKSSSSKIAKQSSLAFVKRTLERCQKFEDTGKSCFSEPLFRDMFLYGFDLNPAQSVHCMTEGESFKTCMNVGVSGSMSSQQSPSLSSKLGHNSDSHDVFSSDLPGNHISQHAREDTWSNRAKKREVLLDDMCATFDSSSVLSSSTKGKRSERDREGQILSRNGTARVGRPSLSSNIRGERKPKSKLKQKTQSSASVNGLLRKMSQPSKPVFTSFNSSQWNPDGKDTLGSSLLDESETLDLSGLELPGMDELGGQGQDLSSWLNIDDDVLQDHDFMGLEIPMDDLSELNMMI